MRITCRLGLGILDICRITLTSASDHLIPNRLQTGTSVRRIGKPGHAPVTKDRNNQSTSGSRAYSFVLSPFALASGLPRQVLLTRSPSRSCYPLAPLGAVLICRANAGVPEHAADLLHK